MTTTEEKHPFKGISEFALPSETRELAIRLHQEFLFPCHQAVAAVEKTFAEQRRCREEKWSGAQKKAEQEETAADADFRRKVDAPEALQSSLRSEYQKARNHLIHFAVHTPIDPAWETFQNQLDVSWSKATESLSVVQNGCARILNVPVQESPVRPNSNDVTWAFVILAFFLACFVLSVVPIPMFFGFIPIWFLLYLVLLFAWRKLRAAEVTELLDQVVRAGVLAAGGANLQISMARKRRLEVEAESQAELAKAKSQYQVELAEAEAEQLEKLQKIKNNFIPVVEQLQNDFSAFWTKASFSGCDWNDELWKDWVPDPSPEFAGRVGTFFLSANTVPEISTLRTRFPDFRNLNLQFSLPALIPFSDNHCLLFNATGVSKETAAQALQSVAIRALANTPPGKARFTLIDPVGLGQNVADFMHLGDHHKDLINAQAWTEPEHIEQQLTDLTKHIETVIQKYLRNEFTTILDFNRSAHEVAEAFRFLLVFDFPVNFSETSARRLVSIVKNGPRCGVFTLILRDTAKSAPYGFNTKDLEDAATQISLLRSPVPLVGTTTAQASGAVMNTTSPTGLRTHLVTVLAARAAIMRQKGPCEASKRLCDKNREPQLPPSFIGCFVWEDQDFSRFSLRLDTMPSQNLSHLIIGKSGELAVQAMKVEVPFENLLVRASLGPDSWWKSSTAKNLEVPLGPSGARKLQYLKFGEGLTHHALVVGRAGSGKTNLMHVIITNLALAYSPHEMTVYLIDLKGGVGFKPYADHRLPHAAVIAIESEREFGISVLQGLDAELKRRFIVFRAAGVEDLAHYRAKMSGAPPMPRILLVVDEFQEFFAQDDGISEQAKMIFDRIVRQGRSFGMHILLGTQSLEGTGRLASSTMGQMAVRIALPCSENDSRLILAEGNKAARSLSRPGDAIYNSAAGLVEGNSPFQVALFTDVDLEKHLKAVTLLAQEQLISSNPIVFEGNEPAHLQECKPLLKLLEAERWTTAPGSALAWLGEPVAMLPPVHAAFRRQTGRHLLIIHREEADGVGLLISAWVSLLCHHRPTTAQYFMLDLATAETQWAGYSTAIQEIFHHIKLLNRRDLPGVLKSLVATTNDRLKSQRTDEPPIYLLIQGLHRARDLRPSEDNPYSSNRGVDPSPGELFATLLKDGPEFGIHVIAWCDTVTNARRTVDRALGEFGMRLAGPMSAEDSNTFLDSSGAACLEKPHRVLFSDEEKPGVMQKFRPYALPPLEWLSDIEVKQKSWPHK